MHAHARLIRPSTGPTDRRRLLAAATSSLLPGLGQLANGEHRLAVRFALPSLAVVAIAWLIVSTTSPTRLVAAAVAPTALTALMVLNVAVLGWRAVAAVQAFIAPRYRGQPMGRGAVFGLIALLAFVAAPHALAAWYGSLAGQTFETIFAASASPRGGPAGPTPGEGERVNVLLIGLDTGPRRGHELADTIMVVSLDPVGRTVSMASIPRDLVDVPLGNGDVFAPKINSLLPYADRHPGAFPAGGTRALADAVGALLGIPIHYQATLDLRGFIKLVDAVGGVDVTVKRPLSDPTYDEFGVGAGWSITAGRHHLDGANALAYARIRKSPGETDFTRAERQQQLLVAIRKAAVNGDLLFRLPALLDALGETIRTDFPIDRLPEMVAFAEEIPDSAVVRVVIRHPLVRPGGRDHPYGSVQVPDLVAIRAMAAQLFSPPGTPPADWPTPKPTKPPKSAAPSP